MATTGSRGVAQGVCTKNPVKELICLKHGGHLFPSPGKQSSQGTKCGGQEQSAVLTEVLQQRKRAAAGLCTDASCPKRRTSLQDTFVIPSSHGNGERTALACSSKGYMDITDNVQHVTACPPISIATVQVQESSALAPPTMPCALTELGVLPPLVHPSPYPTYLSWGMSFFEWQIEQEESRLSGLSVEQLLERDSDGDTFLHVAVAQGRRALACVLARRMSSVGMLDLKEHNGQSALQLSVAANQHLIVKDLLFLGAQMNTVDRWGRTPLHVCAEKGHALTLQAIRRASGPGRRLEVDAVNYDGLTALHTAVLTHNALVRELAGAVASRSMATDALLRRRKLLGECVSTLLLMGASYRTKDLRNGRTCLHMAAEEANVELLRLFLEQPDSLTVVNDKAHDGNSALHVVSALQGRVAQLEAVKLLLRKGADPGARNLENEQPAHLVPEGPVGDQVLRILEGRGSVARSSPL